MAGLASSVISSPTANQLRARLHELRKCTESGAGIQGLGPVLKNVKLRCLRQPLPLGEVHCDRYLTMVIWLPLLLKLTWSMNVRISSRPRPLIRFN
jgi:hypothetical protein